MRAVHITKLEGPSAVEVVEVDEPPGGDQVLVDVHVAGVSFPEVLQTRGEYQFKPELPFVPGSEVAGVVREVNGDAQVAVGDRVAAFCFLGAFAEVAVAPTWFTFKLPDALDF